MTSTEASRDERSFIERSVPWWHVMFAIVAFATGVALVASTNLPLANRVLGLTVLALMIAAYALFGRRMFYAFGMRGRAWYVAFVVLATLVLIGLGPAGYLAMFAAFPQIWSMLPIRWAIGYSSGLVLGLSGLIIVRAGWTTDAMLSAGLTAFLILGTGMLMGLWIHGIVSESERRKALIAELRQTREDLAESHHREGVLAERERLAAEIHDTLAQAFLSILVQAQAAEAGTSDAAVRERLALIERTARENLSEARSLVAALSPTDLRGRTLADAIQRVVDRADVKTQLVIDGEPRTLPANSEVVLLRATQEALTNVHKHAGASRADVRLSYQEDGVTLDVRDDGRGFVLDEADGFGLRSMRSRVEQVFGTMSVDTAPGNGTTIRLVVP